MRVGLVALLLVGCPDTTKDSGADVPPVDQNTDTDPVVCEGAAPVLEELVVEDYGELYDFEDGPAPALLVSATGADDDGDLHRMKLVVWWDDVVDGSVDTSVEGEDLGYVAMDEQTCGTSRATYGIVFEVDGVRFDYNTAYEFAGEVYDDAGMASEQVVASGTTPGPAE